MIGRETRDWSLIRGIMTHPKIWPHISDDGSPSPQLFSPVKEHVRYCLVLNDDDVVGVFLFHAHNVATAEVHTCVLPKYWGQSQEAGIAALVWAFDQTGWNKIITHVPTPNRLAYRLALKVGMKLEGVNRLSYLKDGFFHDQYLLGITRAELCQQQQL